MPTTSINGKGAPNQTASWSAWSTVHCPIEIPSCASRPASNGNHPIYINLAQVYAGGHGASTNVRAQIAGYTSPYWNVPSSDGGHLGPNVGIGYWLHDTVGGHYSTLTLRDWSGGLYFGWDSGSSLTTTDGHTNWGGTLCGNITYLTAPTGVRSARVTSISSTSARIAWTAPADIGGTRITKYVIYWKAVNGGALHTISVSGSTLSTTIAGLTPGVAYSFYVGASNYVTDHYGYSSPFSNTASFTTQAGGGKVRVNGGWANGVGRIRENGVWVPLTGKIRQSSAWVDLGE